MAPAVPNRRAVALAAIATTVVVAVLTLLAPARHVSGDTVPGRYGAALLACGGGFDLRRVAWIDALDRGGRQPYWLVPTPNGGLASVYGPGPALAGALAMVGTRDGVDDDALRRRERVTAAALLGLAAGLLVVAASARRGGRASAAIGAVGALSFAGAATLGLGLWQQTVALPFLVGGLAAIAWRERAPGVALAAPALLLVAVLLRPTIAPLAVGLGIAWCVERRSPRVWALAAAIAVVAAIPLVAWNVVVLGTPLPIGQLAANARVTDEVFVVSRAQLGYGLGGLLVSPARGLLWFAPIALVGVVVALRRGPRVERVIAAAIVAQIVVVAMFHMWWGGICFGPRFLAEATWIGAWLALGSGCVTRTRVERVLVVLAAGVTVVVGVLGLALWRAEQWETRRNPDIDQNALWDVSDGPLPSLFRSIDDQPLAIDADVPARVRCVDGTLR